MLRSLVALVLGGLSASRASLSAELFAMHLHPRRLVRTSPLLVGVLACGGETSVGPPPLVTSLRLGTESVSIVVAGSVRLVPRDSLGNLVGPVDWSSADPRIATVVDANRVGRVTGAARGTTIVRAEANGHRDSVVVHVDVVAFSTSSGPCGLTTQGLTYCWAWLSPGTAFEGAEATAPARLDVPALVTLSVRPGNACGLTSAGSAYCWTQGRYAYSPSSPTVVPGGLTLTAVSASLNSACGLDGGGQAFCWLTVYRREPVPVPGGMTFTAIASGGSHGCALASGGAVFCWGSNQYGQLGRSDSLQTCYGGIIPLSYACSDAPVMVSGGHLFALITPGFNHACGITTDGHAFCWGSNQYGQLGADSVADSCLRDLGYSVTIPCSFTPVPVSGSLTFASLSAAGDYTCGVTAAGAANCWGANYDGVLGDGTTTQRSSPHPVTGGHAFAAVSASGSQTCGLTQSAILFCWGQGPLGDGRFDNSSVPVRVLGQP